MLESGMTFFIGAEKQLEYWRALLDFGIHVLNAEYYQLIRSCTKLLLN